MPDPNEEEFESPEQFAIKRDEDGDLIPMRGKTPQGNPVIIKPMPYGALKKYFSDIQPDSDIEDIGFDIVAEILNLYFIKPDFAGMNDGKGVTAEDLENRLVHTKIDEYLTALYLLSTEDYTTLNAIDDSEEADIKNSS